MSNRKLTGQFSYQVTINQNKSNMYPNRQWKRSRNAYAKLKIKTVLYSFLMKAFGNNMRCERTICHHKKNFGNKELEFKEEFHMKISF